jgi:hypothetical protein
MLLAHETAQLKFKKDLNTKPEDLLTEEVALFFAVDVPFWKKLSQAQRDAVAAYAGFLDEQDKEGGSRFRSGGIGRLNRYVEGKPTDAAMKELADDVKEFAWFAGQRFNLDKSMEFLQALDNILDAKQVARRENLQSALDALNHISSEITLKSESVRKLDPGWWGGWVSAEHTKAQIELQQLQEEREKIKRKITELRQLQKGRDKTSTNKKRVSAESALEIKAAPAPVTPVGIVEPRISTVRRENLKPEERKVLLREQFSLDSKDWVYRNKGITVRLNTSYLDNFDTEIRAAPGPGREFGIQMTVGDKRLPWITDMIRWPIKVQTSEDGYNWTPVELTELERSVINEAIEYFHPQLRQIEEFLMIPHIWRIYNLATLPSSHAYFKFIPPTAALAKQACQIGLQISACVLLP